MMNLFSHGLFAAAVMLRETLWALVLGLSLSAFIQVFFRNEQITRQFGRAGLRGVALAALLGAVSSSCSCAAAETSKFKPAGAGQGFKERAEFFAFSQNLIPASPCCTFLYLAAGKSGGRPARQREFSAARPPAIFSFPKLVASFYFLQTSARVDSY